MALQTIIEFSSRLWISQQHLQTSGNKFIFRTNWKKEEIQFSIKCCLTNTLIENSVSSYACLKDQTHYLDISKYHNLIITFYNIVPCLILHFEIQCMIIHTPYRYLLRILQSFFRYNGRHTFIKDTRSQLNRLNQKQSP